MYLELHYLEEFLYSEDPDNFLKPVFKHLLHLMQKGILLICIRKI